MSEITLTLTELGVVVMTAVGLAATDASAISRLLLTFAAKKLGVEPQEIMQYGDAAEGNDEDVDQNT